MNPAVLFVEGLTELDFCYPDPLLGLVGETWITDVELEGSLDAQGFLMDFGPAKRLLKYTLDMALDHKLWIPEDGPDFERQEGNGKVEVSGRGGDWEFRYRAPREAVCFVAGESVSPRSMETFAASALRSVLPDNVGECRVTFRLPPDEGPGFRYCHGLRRHAGNCQRMAHGHRSRVRVWRDGVEAPGAAREWAARWQGKYLANSTDVLTGNGSTCRMRYRGGQGEFELELPAARCEILPCPSTIEHLSRFAAATLREENPGRWRVRLYEGARKGATAEA